MSSSQKKMQNRTNHQPINQSFQPSIFNQSTYQPTPKSINQPTNQSLRVIPDHHQPSSSPPYRINTNTNEPTTTPSSSSPSSPCRQPSTQRRTVVYQPTNEQTNPPTHQPTDRINQPTKPTSTRPTNYFSLSQPGNTIICY